MSTGNNQQVPRCVRVNIDRGKRILTVGTLDSLNTNEANSIMAMTQAATTAVNSAYAPDGINIGINQGRAAGAGLPNHLHAHERSSMLC